MKTFIRLTLTLIIIIYSVKTFGQKVYIPDVNFRFILSRDYPACMNGDSLITDCPDIKEVTELNLSSQSISSIKGVEYFSNLRLLTLYSNNVVTIDSLPGKLEILRCQDNSLVSIPKLPDGLLDLDVGKNNLSDLGILPPSLESLVCFYNSLNNLPTLPETLEYLSCGYNPLSMLPILPNSLCSLYCSGTSVVCLPNIPSCPIFYSNIGYNVCPTNSNTIVFKEKVNIAIWGNNIKIINSSTTGRYFFEIIDIHGREIIALQNLKSDEQINISKFPEGIYFIRLFVEHSNVFLTKKFIVNNN